MGQKWSAFKNTRAGIEGAQWFSKAKLKASRKIRELPVEPVQKTIFDLPTEIVLNIAEYLPPSSLVSFELFILENLPSAMHLTSIEKLKKMRKTQYSFSDIEDPLAKLDSICKKQGTPYPEYMPTSRTQLNLSERLELLRMLDRDGSIPSSQAVCSGCADTHAFSLFSVSSLAQPSSERRCLGSAGSMWICPHRILDCGQAQIPEEAQESHFCEGKGVAVLRRQLTSWRIMKATHNDPPLKDQVKEALRPLTAHICPHLRLNDSYVSSVYFEDCRMLPWSWVEPWLDCECPGCSLRPPQRTVFRGGKCKYCGTTFFFSISSPLFFSFSSPLGDRVLQVHILRNMKRNLGCTDNAWIAQVIDPAEFKEYESAWHATNVLCKGRLYQS